MPAHTVDLQGLIDLHLHTAPDVTPRRCSDLEAARLARDAGMRALLIKSHDAPTAARAALAEEAVGGIRVFGGLALNAATGGLNPAAVEAALRMGAVEIWMPTRSAAHVLPQGGRPAGLSPFDRRGRPRPGVREILALIREADAILGTGHLSPAETVRLVRLARRLGVHKVLVTHPEAPFIAMDVATQRALAAEGACFERCALFATPPGAPGASVARIAAEIRAVGVASTVLATDLGQPQGALPVDGLRAFLAGLLGEGFSPDEVRRMAGQHPARLLGLE